MFAVTLQLTPAWTNDISGFIQDKWLVNLDKSKFVQWPNYNLILGGEVREAIWHYYSFFAVLVSIIIVSCFQADKIVPYFGDLFTDEPLPADGYIDLPAR